MNWIRHNWLGVVVLAAIILSFVVANHDSKGRDRAQASQIVAGCVRTSARAAVTANGEFVLAQRVGGRGAPGDAESARRYNAVGNSIVATIPVPKGIPEGDKRMAEVILDDRHTKSPKDDMFELTAGAKALQKLGCDRAYG